MKKATTMTHISLPLAAFRESMLSGTLEAQSPGTGDYNIPSTPHETVPVSLSAGVDYLTLMYEGDGSIDEECSRWEELLEVKLNVMDRTLYESPFGAWTKISGSLGASLEYKYLPNHTLSYRVSAGGSVWGYLSEVQLRRVYDYASQKQGFHCTRIDLKIDDTTGILDLDKIEEALREFEYAGFLSGELIESFNGDNAGKTVYFGGRKSIQRMRFYDKQAQAKLEYPCIRQELQCRAARADEVYQYLFSEGGDLWRRLVNRVVSAMTFGVRTDKNLNRLRVASFWKDWVEYTRSTITRPPSIGRLTSVDRTLNWMARSVAKSIARAGELFTKEGFLRFVSLLIKKGTRGMREKDWSEIALWVDENSEDEFLSQLEYNIGVDLTPV